MSKKVKNDHFGSSRWVWTPSSNFLIFGEKLYIGWGYLKIVKSRAPFASEGHNSRLSAKNGPFLAIAKSEKFDILNRLNPEIWDSGH